MGDNDGNPALFTRPNGEPVGFYFHRSITEGQREALQQKIEGNGGTISDVEDEANVVLVHHEQLAAVSFKYSHSKTVYVEPPDFVQKCINRRLYEHDKPERKRMGGVANVTGRPRMEFTPEEDEHLARYIAARCPTTMDGRRGNGIYKELVRMCQMGHAYPWASTHTWHSWRERYVKSRREEIDQRIEEILEKEPPHPDGKGEYHLYRDAYKPRGARRQKRRRVEGEERHVEGEEEIDFDGLERIDQGEEEDEEGFPFSRTEEPELPHRRRQPRERTPAATVAGPSKRKGDRIPEDETFIGFGDLDLTLSPSPQSPRRPSSLAPRNEQALPMSSQATLVATQAPEPSQPPNWPPASRRAQNASAGSSVSQAAGAVIVTARRTQRPTTTQDASTSGALQTPVQPSTPIEQRTRSARKTPYSSPSKLQRSLAQQPAVEVVVEPPPAQPYTGRMTRARSRSVEPQQVIVPQRTRNRRKRAASPSVSEVGTSRSPATRGTKKGPPSKRGKSNHEPVVRMETLDEEEQMEMVADPDAVMMDIENIPPVESSTNTGAVLPETYIEELAVENALAVLHDDEDTQRSNADEPAPRMPQKEEEEEEEESDDEEAPEFTLRQELLLQGIKGLAKAPAKTQATRKASQRAMSKASAASPTRAAGADDPFALTPMTNTISLAQQAPSPGSPPATRTRLRSGTRTLGHTAVLPAGAKATTISSESDFPTPGTRAREEKERRVSEGWQMPFAPAPGTKAAELVASGGTGGVRRARRRAER